MRMHLSATRDGLAFMYYVDILMKQSVIWKENMLVNAQG